MLRRGKLLKNIERKFFYFHLSFTIGKAATNTVGPWPMLVWQSAQFTKPWSIHRGFAHWKITDDSKKVDSAIGNWFQIFSSHLCQSLYDWKPKAQSKLCVPLAFKFLMANYCTRWYGIFKGLSQDGGCAEFSKNLCASLFNKYLSIEPNFGRNHLAGQYL
jgi:hypothetical protein